MAARRLGPTDQQTEIGEIVEGTSGSSYPPGLTPEMLKTINSLRNTKFPDLSSMQRTIDAIGRRMELQSPDPVAMKRMIDLVSSRMEGPDLSSMQRTIDAIGRRMELQSPDPVATKRMIDLVSSRMEGPDLSSMQRTIDAIGRLSVPDVSALQKAAETVGRMQVQNTAAIQRAAEAVGEMQGRDLSSMQRTIDSVGRLASPDLSSMQLLIDRVARLETPDASTLERTMQMVTEAVESEETRADVDRFAEVLGDPAPSDAGGDGEFGAFLEQVLARALGDVGETDEDGDSGLSRRTRLAGAYYLGVLAFSVALYLCLMYPEQADAAWELRDIFALAAGVAVLAYRASGKD